MGKHEKEFKNLEKELNHVRKKQLYIPQLWNAVYLVASILSMYWIVSNIIKGEISLGGMVGIIQSISLFCASCQWLVFSFSNLGVSQLFFLSTQRNRKSGFQPRVQICVISHA